MQRNTGRRRGLLMVVVVATLVALLFFFERLGSEQPQKWVETPIVVPPEPGAADKGRK